MAKTYRRLPHEILSLRAEELALAVLCLGAADERDEEALKGAKNVQATYQIGER